MRVINRVILCVIGALIVSVTSLKVVSAQLSDLHAIVESDGKVVLCLLRGEILFSDRCEGTGRLTIVQSIKEGPIVWRSASGTVAMENDSPQNPDCALSRAKWDPKSERTTSSGKRIRNVEQAMLPLMRKAFPNVANLQEGDIKAFALDLDNDGKDEIIFSASNVDRIAKLQEKSGGSFPYVLLGGILNPSPAVFHFEGGEYSGGTDAIGHININGIVPIAASTGEIALLIETRSFGDTQDLIRFRQSAIQRIETIKFRCQ